MSFAGYLRQSTAVDVLIGPFVDEDDGKTAETGLTISQGDVKLSKNGQTLAQKNDNTAAAADANGYYNCELDATDTNTLGQLTLIVHESGALPIRLDFQVIAQANYDNLFSTTDIVDNIWDELIQGSDHNTKFSTGRRLKDASTGGNPGGGNPVISPVTVYSGTAQGGTTNTITLGTDAIATDNIYRGSLINITGGTGVGQTNVIYSYDGTTKVATMAKDWITIPDATSTLDVLASSTAINADEGVAQAGGAATITLAATASADDDIYKGALITIVSGTGSGQSREILAYNGTSKIATVAAWGTQPDTTSVYAVIPDKEVSGDTITNEIINQDISNVTNTTYTTIYEGSDVATLSKTWADATTLAATSAYGGVVAVVAADQAYDYTSNVDLVTNGYNGCHILVEFKGSASSDALIVDIFGSLDGSTYDNEPYSHTLMKSSGGWQSFSLIVKDLPHFRIGLKGSNTNDTFEYKIAYRPWT